MSRLFAALMSFITAFVVAGSADAKRNKVDEPAIERIEEIRAALLEEDEAIDDEDSRVAQWYNWPNWGNWPNWHNWPNY
ncbi:hypothetical protein AB1K42_18040 [Roseibium algicola]|uniref:hypothetical protein n=1 Tax=Roseibium algicola TaxID=2857014 RepID=UPI0034583D36